MMYGPELSEGLRPFNFVLRRTKQSLLNAGECGKRRGWWAGKIMIQFKKFNWRTEETGRMWIKSMGRSSGRQVGDKTRNKRRIAGAARWEEYMNVGDDVRCSKSPSFLQGWGTKSRQGSMPETLNCSKGFCLSGGKKG